MSILSQEQNVPEPPTVTPAVHTLLPSLFPSRTPPTASQIHTNLQACLSLQRTAVTDHHKRPFCAILIAPDNVTILLTHFSISEVSHAESSLAQLAYAHYTKEYLWRCTLYSTWEPCAMCSGTIYWAHIGGVIFAASNADLEALTGVGNVENFTMGWGAREVLARGQKGVWVVGPVDGIREKVIWESEKFWSGTRGKGEGREKV